MQNKFKQGRNLLRFVQDVNSGKRATYSIVTGIYNPTEGFAVSLKGREQVTKLQKDNSLVIREYIRKNGLELDQEEVMLGSWIHEGNLYLDLTICIPTLSEALKLGKANCQIAIFDNKNQLLIYI